MTSTEIGAVYSMPAYPMTVLRGCAAVDEIDALKNLPDGFIRVVMRLIKKIDVTMPKKPIFARRQTLAQEAGKSCETVGRALKWLEDNGFITRNQITRKFLRGSDSHIIPTQKMIQALGFNHRYTGQQEGEAGGVPSENEPPVKNEGSLSALHNQNINIHKQSSKIAETLSTTNKSSCAFGKVKIQGKTLPIDLVWLVEKGNLKATAVLSLMKLARRSGKLLSDVVQVTRQYLENLKGHNLFAYVRSLLNQEKDFGYIAKLENSSVMQKQVEDLNKEMINRKSIEWIGRRFKSASSDQTYIVERNGFVAVMNRTKCVASKHIDKKFVDAVMDGRLQIVR